MGDLGDGDSVGAIDYLKISGTVKGSIKGKCNVVIVSEGNCKVNIKAFSLVISGEVTGNVAVDDLEINSQGSLYFGRAQYKNLVLHDGAVLLPLDKRAKKVVSSPPKLSVVQAIPVASPKESSLGEQKPGNNQLSFYNSY